MAPPLVTFIETDGNVPKLASDVPTDVYADECRSIGLAFLEGAQLGWGKRELAAWLVGPYQAVSVRLAATGASCGSSQARSDAVATPVTESAVLELLGLVRIAVASAISELRGGDTSCVTHAIREKLITSAHDERGMVWIPTDRPRLRLEARVLSLFIVDYLLRTERYERGDVSVCSECDAVSFEGDRPCIACDDHVHSSQVRGTARTPGLLAPLVAPVKIVG